MCIPSQLHHFTTAVKEEDGASEGASKLSEDGHTAAITSEALWENEVKPLKKKKMKGPKVDLAPNGWRLFGAGGDFGDTERTAWEATYRLDQLSGADPESDKALKRKRRGPAKPIVDRKRSVAFPGSKHHPYQKEAGSFSLDSFLIENLKHRPVFVAGEYKVRVLWPE